MRLIQLFHALTLLSLFCLAPVYAFEAETYLLATDELPQFRPVTEPIPAEETTAGNISLTGGEFWFATDLTLTEDMRLVIDFSSSTTVAKFVHHVHDLNGPIVTFEGGQKSNQLNPFLLRHGRELALKSGQYRIYTQINSPFYLGQIRPKVFELESYQRSIKAGNLIALAGIGIFFSLGIYYLALGLMRRNMADLLYAVFIVANLIFNATALNIFSDIFNMSIFYTIGYPIMASNIAYIGFVMKLLDITTSTAKYLYRIGVTAMLILASFWPIALLYPNLSLEFARFGVAIFSLYGISSGVVMLIRGVRIARYYLFANAAFVIPAFIAISLQETSGALVIEHIGLIAVATEVILLSMVVSFRYSEMEKDKASSLEATQNALSLADQAVKTKERFLANISHELRTPLNAIQGSVELIDSTKIHSSERKYLEIIQHSSEFLLFLINDILDLAKAKAGKLKIETQPIELRHLLSNITRIYSQGLDPTHELTFRLSVDNNVPNYILSDEHRIEQILANLLSNAFKFTQQGSVELHVEVINDGKHLKMSVIDSGIGIAEEKLESIFQEFTQADTSITRKFGGTGLGLPIAARIATLLGGQVGAQNNPDVGACFWLILPLMQPTERPVNPGLNSELEVSYLQSARIAVVDDNAVNLKIVQAQLKKYRCQTHCYLSARQALEHINTNTIDLVIMDIQMPDIDGLEACKLLRLSGFKGPIIAFTANASEADLQQCWDAGMDDILVKPIKQQQLAVMLEKWYQPAPES